MLKPVFDFKANEQLGYRLWHCLVAFGCEISIPDEEEGLAKELLSPIIRHAMLTNDLFSFEKEKHDVNCQNAVLIVMKEHSCGEQEAREILKKRIRLETKNVLQTVKEVKARTDISDDLKRYIEVMMYTVSGNVAWSQVCPRYNQQARFSDIQIRRAKEGIEHHPSRYPLKNGQRSNVVDPHVMVRLQDVNMADSNGRAICQFRSNGKPFSQHTASGLKRIASCNERAMNKKSTGVNGIYQPAHNSHWGSSSTDSLVFENVVSLALDCDLPELCDDVSTVRLHEARQTTHR